MKKRSVLSRKLYFMLLLMLLIVILSVFAERICPHDPYLVDETIALHSPSGEYLLGTDALGRCVACRILCGLKYSLFSSLAIVAMTGLTGIMLGVAGAYFGKAIDRALLYLNVVFQSFPGFVLAIFVAGILGNGLINGVIALSITGWTRYARLSRSLTLDIMHCEYVRSAKLSGLKMPAIVWRHIVPNIVMPLVVTMTLSVSDAVVGIAGLSFLGIGAAPPLPEWGTMLSEARAYLQIAPWTVIAPGIALFALVLVFNAFADTLQNVVDPRSANKSLREKKRAIKAQSLKPVS